MSNPLRKLAIYLVTPLSWRASQRRLAESLHRFALVEADSAWQMLQALKAVDDDHFRAELFNNALEEVHHAYLFHRLARRYTPTPLPLSAPRRKQIYDSERGMVEFEAYHYVGEVDVYEEFLHYARAAHLEPVRETFLAIRGDEEEHQKLAYAELVRLSGSEKAARRLIRRIRRSRLLDGWNRFSKALGETMFSVILSAVYFVAAPFTAGACRRRLDAGAGTP